MRQIYVQYNVTSDNKQYLISQLQKIALKDDELNEMNKLHHPFGINDVLVHGDIHVNNMLFTLDKHSKPTGTLAALIDWQVVTSNNVRLIL